MTHVWPLLGLAPVPTVVSMNFRPVSVVMAVPCVCAATGQAAARVAVAITTRRVTGMRRLLLGGSRVEPAIRNNGWQAKPDHGGARRIGNAETTFPAFCSISGQLDLKCLLPVVCWMAGAVRYRHYHRWSRTSIWRPLSIDHERKRLRKLWPRSSLPWIGAMLPV